MIIIVQKSALPVLEMVLSFASSLRDITMLVIFFLISFKKQASCKFINFAQVFVNVGSEMAYHLPLRLSL